MKALVIICCILCVLLFIFISFLVFLIKKNKETENLIKQLESANKSYLNTIQRFYKYLSEKNLIDEWEKNFNEKAKNNVITLADLININNQRVPNNTAK